MRALRRSALAVVAGALVGGVLIALVETISSMVYPPPPGLDLNDPGQLSQFVAGLPLGAFLFVLAAWALGTTAGSWLAARLARRAPLVHGMIVGAFFLVGGVANMLMIPHPLWMWPASLVIFVGCSYLGSWLGARNAAGRTPGLLTSTI